VSTATGAEPITKRQLWKVEDLNGDLTYAHKLSKKEAIVYIDSLINRPVPAPEPPAPVPTRRKPVDPRLPMIETMLNGVPDGYYAAVPTGDVSHVEYLMISRPNRGRYAGAIKIQTQHSDAWKEALIRWPSGVWSAYRPSSIETLMLVVADKNTCAMRYAIEMQRCQVCNKKLTDDRSRHYLIGPECEKKSGGQRKIEDVDEINGGLSFEQMTFRGLPTRVWQDDHLKV
jgi:hypothetical protein